MRLYVRTEIILKFDKKKWVDTCVCLCKNRVYGSYTVVMGAEPLSCDTISRGKLLGKSGREEVVLRIEVRKSEESSNCVHISLNFPINLYRIIFLQHDLLNDLKVLHFYFWNFSEFSLKFHWNFWSKNRHGILPDGTRLPNIRPLNIRRDYYTIMRRGRERNARARRLDAETLRQYASQGDVFIQDNRTENMDYSPQVDNITYEARVTALHELADGIKRGENS